MNQLSEWFNYSLIVHLKFFLEHANKGERTDKKYWNSVLLDYIKKTLGLLYYVEFHILNSTQYLIMRHLSTNSLGSLGKNQYLFFISSCTLCTGSIRCSFSHLVWLNKHSNSTDNKAKLEQPHHTSLSVWYCCNVSHYTWTGIQFYSQQTMIRFKQTLF